MGYYRTNQYTGGLEFHGSDGHAAATVLSAPVIIQNKPPAQVDHGISLTDAWYYQQFKLPTDYVRGQSTPPPITGIQVKTKVPKHLMAHATIDYTLDVREGSRWNTLSQGTSIGAATFGDEVWFTIKFSGFATVTPAMLNETFRFGVKGRQPAPVHKRHKCLPIRRWNNNWYYYNYLSYYGQGDFSVYGYNSFYNNYPYYEWGYYGFPYQYNYPWWQSYGYGYSGSNIIETNPVTHEFIRLPWYSPYGWNWPYSYYNSNFYNNYYNYYYGYPYSPYSFYNYYYNSYYSQTYGRWWNNWDNWGWNGESFPILAFDDGVISNDLTDLEVDMVYPLDFDGSPCYITKHAEVEQDEQWGFEHQYCLNTQQGLDWLWFTSPNPYVRVEDSYVTDNNEQQVLQDGNSISFMFRLLSLVADSGLDELGQPYRNTVVIHGVNNLNTTYSAGIPNQNWMSKPNPSKFAVENLFADISDADNIAQVIDRVYLDPITPNVYFSIYYSNDGLPSPTTDGWENKLWTRVPKTYKLTKADSYALPTPITAKYINIEFSYLQAKPYNAPDLAQPVFYKKHPKWVLDYFIAREAELQDNSKFVSNSIAVTYNAYDLAYNYYLDDIGHSPNSPDLTLTTPADVNNFFGSRSDLSDKIDVSMVGQISTVLNPYLSTPTVNSNLNYLVTQYASNPAGSAVGPYPVEKNPQTLLPQINSSVSSLNRDQIVFEKSMPIMYFYLPSRHVYRLVKANFSSGVSYQVGLNELAFQREHYTVAFDSPFYLESGGDNVNIEQNDFVRVDNAWAIYAKAQHS